MVRVETLSERGTGRCLRYRRFTAALSLIVLLASTVACTHRSAPPTPVPGSQTSALEPTIATGRQPAAPASPTSTPTLGPELARCDQSVLRAVALPPIGATAMMSMFIIIADTGEIPCSLPRPEAVRMVDGAGVEIAHFNADPNRLPPYLDLLATRAPTADELSAPSGAASVWLVWTWRLDGACNALDPPGVRFLVEFAGGMRLEMPDSVVFAPCSAEQRIAGFDLVTN